MSALPNDMPAAGAGAAPGRRAAVVYVVVLVLVALAAFAYKLRSTGIFACPADGYAGDRYLAYCNATGYGDYDQGAFWFGLEAEAAAQAAAADVVFLGNSRTQFGLSSPATADWFRARGLHHYLLGFPVYENARFVAPLLQRRPLRARLYVINVDGFFDDRDSEPFKAIRADRDALSWTQERQRWQPVHRLLCGHWPALCGDAMAIYRARADGSWRSAGRNLYAATAVADVPSAGSTDVAAWAANAGRFLARLPVARRCVVLTLVPTRDTQRADAQALAHELGLELVSPALDGLHTFDGSHLDPPSAQRWSQAFLDAAQPQIDACLNSTH